MLLVNNVALDVLTPKTLMHAEWSGAVHLADLVFPWFLLAVGVSLPFSIASKASRNLSHGQFLLKALRRASILFLLGCVVDSSVQHQIVIGLGVLQLIGLSYLFAAVFAKLPGWARIGIAGVMFVAHWALIRFLPYPGGEGGIFTEEVNAIRYVNETYLESLHLRGLLSVMTTGPLVLIGTWFGDVLRSNSPRTWMKLIWGASAATALGLAVALDIPMNKPVWTTSYVLYSAGTGAFAIVALHLLFDRGKLSWLAYPFVVFGSNAIVAYVAPILFKTLVLRTISVSEGKNLETAMIEGTRARMGVLTGGLFYTSCYILVCWLLVFALYRKKLFLRV